MLGHHPRQQHMANRAHANAEPGVLLPLTPGAAAFAGFRPFGGRRRFFALQAAFFPLHCRLGRCGLAGLGADAHAVEQFEGGEKHDIAIQPLFCQ